MNSISETSLTFLTQLKENNNRDWFNAHKPIFQKEYAKVKSFFEEVMNQLKKHDEIEKLKMYRIYRDIRFSADKTPYKTYFSGNFVRATHRLRGGYYLEISPKGKSFLAGGFWAPNKDDLYRIRKEFEADSSEINEIISEKNFIKYFETLKGETLKTAPRGFDKDHPNVDLIKMKQFVVVKHFTDKEVLSENFINEIDSAYKAMRPFFDYMSEVLTTDLNGVSLID